MTVEALEALLERLEGVDGLDDYRAAVAAELSARLLHEEVAAQVAAAEARLVWDWTEVPTVVAHLGVLGLLGDLEQAQKRLVPVPVVAAGWHADMALKLWAVSA